MEQKTLSADLRKELKKGRTRQLRKAGKIPAVVYGHAGTANVAVDAREFGQKFKRITENTIIRLTFDGSSRDVLVKDFQEDAVSGGIIHIDFYEIESGKLLRTNVPVRLTGNAIGVREGGLLEHRLHEIEVECIPKDIPEEISVDIVSLTLGQSIHVADLPAMEGVRILNTPDQVIVAVTHAKEEVVAAPAAEAEAAAEGEGEAAAESEGEEKAEEE